MSPVELKRTKAILGGASLEEVATWANEYRHDSSGKWTVALVGVDRPSASDAIEGAAAPRVGNHYWQYLRQSIDGLEKEWLQKPGPQGVVVTAKSQVSGAGLLASRCSREVPGSLENRKQLQPCDSRCPDVVLFFSRATHRPV